MATETIGTTPRTKHRSWVSDHTKQLWAKREELRTELAALESTFANGPNKEELRAQIKKLARDG